MSRRFLLAVGVLAVAGLAMFLLAAAGVRPQTAALGWLAASVGWTAISLGCLMLVLVRILVGVGTDAGLGPALMAGANTLPVAGLSFAPVLMMIVLIYPWATVPPSGALQQFWLKPGFFALRSVVYFLSWIAIAALAARPGRKAPAAAGLAVITLTGSWAAVDWMMSLEPKFHSSVYGWMFLGHALLAGWAFATLATYPPSRSPAADGMGVAAATDAGPQWAAGFIIAGIVLWAYLCFCQYLVIWNGNEPDEIRWYLLREAGGWGTAYWAGSLLEGILPFLFLMPARVRANPRMVGLIALSVLAGGMVETAVLVLPSLGRGKTAALCSLPALAAIGGVWLLIFGMRLRRPATVENGLG